MYGFLVVKQGSYQETRYDLSTRIYTRTYRTGHFEVKNRKFKLDEHFLFRAQRAANFLLQKKQYSLT